MKKPTKKASKAPHKYIKIAAAMAALALLGLGVYSVVANKSAQQKSIQNLNSQIAQLAGLQSSNQISVVDTASLLARSKKAESQLKGFDLTASKSTILSLQNDVSKDLHIVQEAVVEKHEQQAAQAALNAKRAQALVNHTPPSNTGRSVQLPILMYHKPPADFDAQMAALKAKGYTTVHMSDVANYFAGSGTLPTKPVVVSFDDGFELQEGALPSLQKYGFKATLYLIVGGDLSHYCIGLLRENVPCGDAYLSVAEVKTMMQSGLIEIGSHTIDHPDLASLSSADQAFQLNTSKQYLENTFNVDVTSFAYPYGEYNATTVNLAREAGYTTAVTTQPGLLQTAAQALLLHRVRSAYTLP